ncbi:helix-turn-helix domain-containing protein [Flavobacterium phragmitis]|uniref:AraC-type DNA-binding protein n=1 Tax=Flavobacterium phragmitis TaxID=739143 RepID=A0A1I1RYV8_9FLAO|nr:AraC family transcriptional regulator [Flavobacterium phragmitis]SFD39496.1 AraC-type DNA-binding protein [Flavobacterium phragmitis]
MLKVKYNLTTYGSFLADVATGFNAVSAKKVVIKNNELVFPESIGKGIFSCYDVDTGLAVVIMDCTFFEDVNFIRLPANVNYFHAMSFNLTNFSSIVNMDGKNGQINGESWQNKIFYSTAKTGLSWTAPQNIPIKIVILLLSQEWVINKFRLKELESRVPHQKELLEDAPLQFSLDMDLETVLLTQEIIASKPPEFFVKLFYKGYVKRLIAHVLDRDKRDLHPEEVLKYQDVLNIVEAKKNIEDHLEQSLPALDDVAKSCGMSSSKFANIFKAMYTKSYLQFFQELKIEKAADLLKKNWEILDVAKSVGFVNQSHFTRVFKEYYRIPPKEYRNAATKH